MRSLLSVTVSRRLRWLKLRSVMLNEDRFSRPRTNLQDRGWGQNYDAEAEANFPRPKINFNIIMFTIQTVQYINVSSSIQQVHRWRSWRRRPWVPFYTAPDPTLASSRNSLYLFRLDQQHYALPVCKPIPTNVTLTFWPKAH